MKVTTPAGLTNWELEKSLERWGVSSVSKVGQTGSEHHIKTSESKSQLVIPTQISR